MGETTERLSLTYSYIQKMTTRYIASTKSIYLGVLVCTLIAIAAIAFGERYSVPSLIVAILLGLALHPLSGTKPLTDGINWSAKSLLYAGVALLGLRIDIGFFAQNGWIIPFVSLSALAVTFIAGQIIGRLFGLDKFLVALMSGAVAICGVSAAAAICCALPRCKERDGQLALTIGGITVLSTAAMILYPIIGHWLSLSDVQAGALMGGSIQNVSQAVGAGYSISGEAGDMATVVKLIRVSALLPMIVLISFVYGKGIGESKSMSWTTYFPPFMIAFFIFVLVNFLHILPEPVIANGLALSEFFLVISLVAIGMNTNIKEVLNIGVKPLVMMILTSLFMLLFVALMSAMLLPNL